MDSQGFAVVTCVLALVLASFAFASPFWVCGNANVYIGLWHVCIKESGSKLTCEMLKNKFIKTEYKGAFHLVRYLNIPGISLLLFCLILTLLGSEYKVSAIAASVVAFLAGGFLLASYCIFAVKLGPQEFPEENFHACFYADIVASILAFLIAMILVKRVASISTTVEPIAIGQAETQLQHAIPLTENGPVLSTGRHMIGYQQREYHGHEQETMNNRHGWYPTTHGQQHNTRGDEHYACQQHNARCDEHYGRQQHETHGDEHYGRQQHKTHGYESNYGRQQYDTRGDEYNVRQQRETRGNTLNRHRLPSPKGPKQPEVHELTTSRESTESWLSEDTIMDEPWQEPDTHFSQPHILAVRNLNF